MPVNKVVFGAVAIMDISDSTVTEDTLCEGATAYDKAGNKITGKMKAGVELPALTSPGSAADLRAGKQLIDGDGNVVEGSMPTATQATPGITVSSAGLITASATQSAGYVAAGTKSATKQLTTQAAKTITPSKSTQTAVASGRYTTGAITVGAIPSQYIVPSGTKSITANGTHDVKSYASVNVAVPTEDLNAVLTEQEALITELETVLAGKAAGGGGASVETCTVTITCTAGLLYNAVFTCFENGQIVTKSKDSYVDGGISSKTIENVVCNSGFFASFSGVSSGMYGYNVSGIESVTIRVGSGGDYYGKVIAEPGGTASMELYDDD